MMSSNIPDQNPQQKDEKQLRSVFVGNIPYEASEEDLKKIFSRIGPVLNFRIVIDRETGKPKGYGFCEYRDTETALSAIRNLNNLELHNRTLRVDSAVNEKGKEEIKEIKASDIPLFGPAVPMETAAESIIEMMSKLSPESLFEILHQIKPWMQTNPEEARELLNQNPQLAYALLQALLVLKLIDAKTAHEMIIKPSCPNEPKMKNTMPPTPHTAEPLNRGYHHPPVNDQSVYQQNNSRDREPAYIRESRNNNDRHRPPLSPEYKRPFNYENERYYDDRYNYSSDFNYDRDRGYQYESYQRDHPSYINYGDSRLISRREREYSPRDSRPRPDNRIPPKNIPMNNSDPRIHAGKPIPPLIHDDHNIDRRDREYTSNPPPMQYNPDGSRYRSSRY